MSDHIVLLGIERTVAGPVLRRVLLALAAQADLPLDRLGDLAVIADRLAEATAIVGPDERLRLEIHVADGALDVRVGPLAKGATKRLIDGSTFPEIGSVLERLSDSVEVTTTDGREVARLAIGQRKLA